MTFIFRLYALCMDRICNSIEWLLGVIERRAYTYRLKLYYRRTGVVPVKVTIGRSMLREAVTVQVSGKPRAKAFKP